MSDPDPEVVALVATAVDAVWPRPAAVGGAPDATHDAWRFSGRWWHRPTPVGRARP